MTAATELRRAATLMRERAEASAPFTQPEGWWQPEGLRDVMWGFDDSIKGVAEDAEHIAGMSPAVALAIADLLDVWADHNLLDSSGSLGAEKSAVLTLVRRYLGEDA